MSEILAKIIAASIIGTLLILFFAVSWFLIFQIIGA